MIRTDNILLGKEMYHVPEGVVMVLSLEYHNARIERYFLIQQHDFEGFEINQISTEMAFRLVRRK